MHYLGVDVVQLFFENHHFFGLFGLIFGFLESIQQHLGVAEDVVERGHLLMAEVGLDGVEVPPVNGALPDLQDLGDVLQKNVDFVHALHFLFNNVQLVNIVAGHLAAARALTIQPIWAARALPNLR
jgi:hypothetical protein